MRFESKHFFYAMIAFTVLSFGGIIGAFYWGNQQLEAKAATLSSLQTDKDIAQEKIIALNRAKQSAELREQAEKLLDSLLPSQKEQEKLVADVIYTAVEEAGIPGESIKSLNFNGGGEASDLSGTEPLTGVAGVYTYPFTMTIQKISYETLLVLLKEIENNGRLVQIDTLQISPDKTVSGQLTSVNLSLKAFLKP